jgi:hypothetical protein
MQSKKQAPNSLSWKVQKISEPAARRFGPRPKENLLYGHIAYSTLPDIK